MRCPSTPELWPEPVATSRRTERFASRGVQKVPDRRGKVPILEGFRRVLPDSQSQGLNLNRDRLVGGQDDIELPAKPAHSTQKRRVIGGRTARRPDLEPRVTGQLKEHFQNLFQSSEKSKQTSKTQKEKDASIIHSLIKYT